MVALAQRVQRIQPSPTLAVTAKAAQLRAEGRDVIGLGAGEPDFDTPPHIKEAAIRAIREGMTKYTPVDGIPSLKEAVVEKFRRENGLEYTLGQVIVSSGGKQCCYNLMQALLDPGDEVVIPAPYWVSYPAMVLLAEGQPVIVEGRQENRFKITPEQLEAAITERTKLFILNSPSNPTGQMYTPSELRALGEVLRRHPHVVVATDDLYEQITWQEGSFCNILNLCPDLYDRTVVLNGVSKAYAMTGWRIGYAAGPPEIIGAMRKIQSQSTSNPASISQAAAEAALRGDRAFIREMVAAFKARHDRVVAALNAIEGVSCLETDGTFYLFPDFSGLIEKKGLRDDVALAERLLEEVGVALVPGSAFGAPGFVRISIATAEELLEEACRRIAHFAGN